MFLKLLDFLFRRRAQDSVLDARLEALSHRDTDCGLRRAVPMFGQKTRGPRPSTQSADQA